MIEQFESGVLPSLESWKAHIELLRKETLPSSKNAVRDALLSAVKKRIPKGHFGIFLSGGVDSSLLALMVKMFSDNFTCYCVGIKGSRDLAAAKKLALELNLNFKCKEFSAEEVLDVCKRAKKLLPSPDVVSVSVAAVVLAAVELAKQDKVSTFFGGLGSEEIFAGYHRHGKAEDVNDECWSGLLNKVWQSDLTRDHALAKALNIKVLVPFLDDDVIKTAMGISGDKKIVGEHKKAVLREIAEELGLPKDIAWRKKSAAQYGSGFDKILDKLCKKEKISKSEFVASM